MRTAESEKYWRKVTSESRPFRADSFEIAEKPPFADGTNSLPRGMTVVCGLNGLGKTSLLRLLSGSLCGLSHLEHVCRPDLLNAGQFSLTLTRDHGNSQVFTLDNADHHDGEVEILDAFELCGRLRALSLDPNYGDLLEGVDPSDYDTLTLDQAQYVIGRQYDWIRVFEIEDSTIDDGVVPFFEAQRNGVAYDAHAMGLGELSALVILWSLNRLRDHSIVLLEEPETFLSSRSATTLLDVLAKHICDRSQYAFITTHSSDVLARVPHKCIRLMVETPDGVVMREPRSRAEVESALGMFTGQCRLLLVEDKTASIFLSHLLTRFVGPWGQSFDIQMCNGESPVKQLCSLIPKTHSLRVVGVLDGDIEPAGETPWPVTNLPGDGDPDTLLRQAALDSQPEFAAALGVGELELATALAPLMGDDPHDWFPNLANSLGVTETIAVRAACTCWLSDPANSTAAQQFAEHLVDLLSSP